MADYSWPKPDDRVLIGKRISRLDGPLKVSGAAKYSYDVHRPGMLAADAGGHIYFGNDSGASLGRMTPGGTFTRYEIEGTPGFDGMVGGFGDIWFTNGRNNSVTRFGTAI